MVQIKYQNTQKLLKCETTKLESRLQEANIDLEKFKDANISVYEHDTLVAKLNEHLEWIQR